jgi:AcrR family transcriptional regulator
VQVADFHRGRVPYQVREEQVLALAESLFAAHGFDGMTMDALAREAGVTKPVIYAVVRSKDELYERCLSRAADELASAVGGALTPRIGDLGAMLSAGNRAYLAFIDSHAAAFAMLFAESAGGRHAAAVAAIRARQARLLVGALHAHAAAVGATVELERLELAVHAMNGAAEAVALWWRDHRHVPSEELASRMTELLLPGLSALFSPAPHLRTA